MKMKVIYRGNPERRETLLRELARILKIMGEIPTIQKVILFGSLVSGEVGIKSDLDLLVIQETEQRPLARVEALMQRINPRVATDILVYTPAEFTRLLEQPNQFMARVLETGRVVYERQPCQ